MSTNAPTPRAERPAPPAALLADGESALKWFDDHVWRNHRICSHCFARVKKTYTDQVDDWGNEDSIDRSTPQATMGYDVETTATRGVRTVRNDDGQVVGIEARRDQQTKRRYPYRITCGECGSVRALKQYDTASKREALDRVPALLNRLQELGVQVNAGVVYDAVRHCKGHPDYEADDKRVFATAVAMGARKA